jgi:hypothetical protein
MPEQQQPPYEIEQTARDLVPGSPLMHLRIRDGFPRVSGSIRANLPKGSDAKSPV